MIKDLLFRFCYRIWDGIVWLFGAAREPKRINPLVYQIISLFLVILVGSLLAYFTPKLPLSNDLGFHWDFVNRCFWGIVWFLLYVFVRLVLYVIELFQMVEASEFEDIDRAWLTGLRELAAKGLDLHNTPIFVVTGLSSTSEETAFLSGAGFHSIATGPDLDEQAPLRIFANNETILVVTTGVSTTSAQINNSVSSTGGASGSAAAGAMDAMATLQPGVTPALVNDSPYEDFGGDAQTLDPSKAIKIQATRTQSVDPLSESKREWCEARLTHLANIITRDRFPLCPINGLIAVVPISWTQTLRPELYKAVQSDIAQLSWSMGLQFPVVCLATGLESLGALNELLTRCRSCDPRFSIGTRAGARFASGQPVSIQNATWAANRSLAWFHQWIYACFAADSSTQGARKNGQLYRLWCSLSQCRDPLASMLETGFGTSGSRLPVRLTGCYFSGHAQRQMIFVRDVLTRLIGAQDQVAWTPERVAKDASLRRWAMIVWVIAAVLGLLNVAMIYDKWFR